jgi:hypothetical protein
MMSFRDYNLRMKVANLIFYNKQESEKILEKLILIKEKIFWSEKIF